MARSDKLLPARRLRLLIRQMGDERGRDTGWKTEVASELGIGPSILSKLDEDPTRSVAGATVQRVIDKLGIAPRFFYDRSIGDAPNYRDFMGEPPAAVPSATTDGATPDAPPEWIEFLEKYEHVAEFSEEQLADIKGFSARQFRVRSWMDYVMVAETVRRARPSPIFEAKKAEREAAKKRGGK